MSEKSLFCKLFVDTELSLNEAVRVAVKFCGGRIDGDTIYSENAVLYFSTNDEYSQARREDFLYSRFIADVEPEHSPAEADYIETVGKVVNGFRTHNVRVVVASDFESELEQFIDRLSD